MRLKFPEDELVFPWLGTLLEAYSIIDDGIEKAVRKEEKRLKKRLACKKGCSHCCLQTDIPVYPLELDGIYWYVAEKMENPFGEALRSNVSDDKGGCFFLVEGVCSIHPVRPVSCRQFNVFGRPCEDGEDPFYTRRGDVLTPIEGFTIKAFSAMLSFYGYSEDAQKEPFRTIAAKEIIHTRILNLREEDRGGILQALDKSRIR